MYDLKKKMLVPFSIPFQCAVRNSSLRRMLEDDDDDDDNDDDFDDDNEDYDVDENDDDALLKAHAGR